MVGGCCRLFLRLLVFSAFKYCPKGPCTQIVDTLAVMWSLHRYFSANAYTTWLHGPLGLLCWRVSGYSVSGFWDLNPKP